ncbi:hypothetical protein H9Y04_02385 [Streptomyces sp. TRM66268-LWL]|uniref:Uncharacterized protein n=1 Tax=Streptomyces polyasparticus TaxID=2767826 RepID=A0ABR7S8W4_9ACTN|nr:hypothetical protein [Streptomyces polyasparticus]MBC9711419.1 hypothetical protein [Streptomyces polyasparticus]
MGRVPARLRAPLVAGLALVLLVGVAVVVLSSGDEEGGHLASNRAQLKRACGGLLPYGELRDLVPDDVRGEAEAYGTQLTPEEESRALLNCSVTWPDRGGVEVRAMPVLSRLPEPATLVSAELAPGAGSDADFEVPGVTGRAGEATPAWLVAECPAGLDTRARAVSALYVTATVTRFGAGARQPGPKARALREFRVAVEVANALTAAQKCGSEAIPLPAEVIDTYEAEVTSDPDGGNMEVEDVDIPGLDAAKCRGLAKEFPGNWSVAGDLQESRLLSVCDATVYDRADPSADTPDLEQGDVDHVSAASWTDPLGESVDAEYGRDGDSYGFRAGERTKELREGEPVELALWAGGRCAAGRTLHQVTVSLYRGGRSGALTEDERTRFSRQARTALDRYLADPAGWPQRQRCHDTKVLGEVEGWR